MQLATGVATDEPAYGSGGWYSLSESGSLVWLSGRGSSELELRWFTREGPPISLPGEVYIEPFKRYGERVRVSTEEGGQPRWRQDGRELFYISPAGALMAVKVEETVSGLEVGIPEVLIEARDLGAVFLGPDYDDYAVTPDGQRFLFKNPAGEKKAQGTLDLSFTDKHNQ